MKIFAAGIMTETNTFSPISTGLEDFRIQRGRDVRAGRVEHPSLDLSNHWGRLAVSRGDTFAFSLMASAEPSGITVKSAYERLRDELLSDLRAAMPVDVVLLMLHGAMVAEGYQDCEEDIIRRVREIAGPDAAIGVELDLHCHLTEAKLAQADIVVTYKEYPHVDVNERAREVFNLTVATRSGEIRPTMALFDCRMVGFYPTSRGPLRDLVDAMQRAEGHGGILSISLGHGFPLGDVPGEAAKVLVITDRDRALAERTAREFGRKFHAARHLVGFDSISLPLEQALSKALASTRTPVVVADQSDNTGGGAPGDATFALRWLLDHQAEDVAIAFLYDPEVVKIARKAGPGARLSVRLGGKLGASSGDPVDLNVEVLVLRDNYVHPLPQNSGETWLFPAGNLALLRIGTVDIVVSSERCQCYSPSVFTDLGLDPTRKRLLIPKSMQHFYEAFAPIAGEVIYMSGPGAVAPDPRQIPYRRLATARLYPWTDDPLPDFPEELPARTAT